MTLKIHFTEEDWQRRERDWNAWWAGELERPLVMIEGLDHTGRLAFGADILAKKLRLKRFSLWDIVYQPLPTLFALDVPAEEVIAQYGRMLGWRRWYGDAFPQWWPNFGPGVGASFLGARLNADPNTVWFDLPQPVELNTWQPEVDFENPIWRRVRELTQMAVQMWGGAVSIGYTDIGGNLDILASLRGTQQLLMDVVEAPEKVSAMAQAVTQAWLAYHRALHEIIHPAGRGFCAWAPLWAPGSSYMLQSDFCYMISPRMFERFVLPDLSACCDALEYPFYHLDGKGEIPHLNHLLSLQKLRGIQWVPGDGAPPPEECLPLLRRIRDGGKLCQLFVSAQGALKIVRELGGRGFALYVRDIMTPAQAEAFLSEVRRLG